MDKLKANTSELKAKVDGYKVYLTSLIMALTALGMIYDSLSTGEGDLLGALNMLFQAFAIAGFRSTANKIMG